MRAGRGCHAVCPIECASTQTYGDRIDWDTHNCSAGNSSRLLTAGEDHTVLVWDMRLQSLPLPDALLSPGPDTDTEVAFALDHEIVAAPGAVVLVGLALIDALTDATAFTVNVAD